MHTVWLICRATGELFLVDTKTTERVVGLEIGYLIETIASDGFFENGDWRVHPSLPEYELKFADFIHPAKPLSDE